MNTISDSMWDEITILKKKNKHKVDTVKAQRDGKTETQCKIKGMTEIHKNRKLDDSTDAQKHNLVPIETSKAIIAARCHKKLTQEQLAKSLNIKKQVIVEYETGKAILNNQLLSKIKKKLGLTK